MNLGDAPDDEISLSFPRRRESMGFWIPACAGMTTDLVFHVKWLRTEQSSLRVTLGLSRKFSRWEFTINRPIGWLMFSLG